jgi:hypothetical protein
LSRPEEKNTKRSYDQIFFFSEPNNKRGH